MLNENDIKVIRGIANAVAERGADWLYPREANNPDWVNETGGCYNLLPDGSGACIIGTLAVLEGMPTVRVSYSSLDADNWGVSLSVKKAMGRAQTMQDQGYTWGYALDAFDKTLTNDGVTLKQIQEIRA